MEEKFPTGAESPTAASEPVAAVPCPEPRMNPTPQNSIIARISGNTRFGVVPTDFVYTAAEPHAVKVIFHQGGGKSTEWTFARDLLAEALGSDKVVAGLGDITIAQSDGKVVMTLNPCTPNSFQFAYPRLAIATFMNMTTRLVMVGAESYDDLDSEIAELLA